jgi:hypothetical protein
MALKAKKSILYYYRKSLYNSNTIFFPPPKKSWIYIFSALTVAATVAVLVAIAYCIHINSEYFTKNLVIFIPICIVLFILFSISAILFNRYFKFWILQRSPVDVIRNKLHFYYKYRWNRNLTKYQVWYYWLIVQRGVPHNKLNIIYDVEHTPEFYRLKESDDRVIDIEDLEFIQDKRERIIDHKINKK